MNIHKFPGQAVRKILLILLLVILAFQTLRTNGPAAAAADDFQKGSDPQLRCGLPTYRDVEIVIMIDDSGSMRTNDPEHRRNDSAKEVVDYLVDQYYLRALMKGSQPNVEIAVIHFSNRIMFSDPITGSPDFIKLNPDNRDYANYEWTEDQEKLHDEIDRNQGREYTLEQTDFLPPLDKARDLWEKAGVLAAQEDGTLRSILIFTDGTPEDGLGRITGQKLSGRMETYGVIGQQLPKLDGLYIVGYKVDRDYFDDDVRAYWDSIAGTLSSGQPGILHVMILEGEDTVEPFQTYLREVATASGNVRQADINEALFAYQDSTLEWDIERAELQVGKQSEIKFRIVPPAADPAYSLKLVSVTPLNADEQVGEPAQKGDHYRVSWEPKNVGKHDFNVLASVVNDKGNILLECSADGSLDVRDQPDPSSSVAISLVIMPPRETPNDRPLILPMRLNFDGDINSVKWDSPHAQIVPGRDQPATGADRLTASVETIPGNLREANLIVGPVGAATEIEVGVGAMVNAGSQDITIPDSTSRIVIAQGPVCDCNTGLWGFWFWPLVIVLAGLMVILLVFRFRSGQDEAEDRQDNWYLLRIRDWHLVFWPLPVLLVLLLLVRLLEWCCIIPPWLFLVSILVWMIMVLLVRFIPGRDIPRPRPWWLVLLLLGLAFIGFLTITIPLISLLWLLLVLLLTWVIVWYIRPHEPRPIVTPFVFSLALTPSCVPFDEAVRLPLRLDYSGQAAAVAPLIWNPTAKILPGGRELTASVRPVDEANGEYELIIDTAMYNRDDREIYVQVGAETKLADGRAIEILGRTTTIKICPPDDLAELEGIGDQVRDFLYEKNISTFKQLARANVTEINDWLNAQGWKMMDAKTWPQQAKLADIAREYGREEDRQSYEAYKAWLKNGIEPDEHNDPEKPRRPIALVWNGITMFTPVVLALTPSSVGRREAVVLPMQLDHDGDDDLYRDVEWEVSARAVPSGKEVRTAVQIVNADRGEYELVIDPVQDEAEKPLEEIQVIAQALVNGRSIEIYGKAITVQISAPPTPDDLEDLEGIGESVRKVLNKNGILTFKELADADIRDITAWLNAEGLKMMDPKTWPQQARLADIAKKYGRDEDLQSYNAYKAWLKDGVEPDEVYTDEKDRRPVALAWPQAAERTPDQLEELEGIGPVIVEVLNDQGIFTFRQLARGEVTVIKAWLDACGFEQMDPKTWPQQAKLADIAREYGIEEVRQSYEAYKAWLKGGIEPDEAGKPENERRQVALVWHGTGARTEAVYSDIFKK